MSSLAEAERLRQEPRVLSVDKGYELWAPTYDHDLNPLLALEERVLTPLLPSLQGKVVLDLGCGTGRWLKRLLESGAREGVGLDASPAMLAQAGSKALLRGRLVRGDGLDIPFRSQAVDLVICSFVIGHLAKLAEFAREVAHVMKPDGDLYVSDLHPQAYARGWRTGFRDGKGNGSREIAALGHSLDRVVEVFQTERLEILHCLQPHLGEAEKHIFEQTGKEPLFQAACELPAVLICHFKHCDST